jgi:Bacterial regulatory proteins, luxR family
VVALIAQGKTDRGIGEELFVTRKTVEAHVRSILSKLELPADASENRRVRAVERRTGSATRMPIAAATFLSTVPTSAMANSVDRETGDPAGEPEQRLLQITTRRRCRQPLAVVRRIEVRVPPLRSPKLVWPESRTPPLIRRLLSPRLVDLEP